MFGDLINDNTNLIQYNGPPLHKARIDAVRLDSIYHIARCMPTICNDKQHITSKIGEGQMELMSCQSCITRNVVGIKDLTNRAL